ncbi:MAG: hypothetical protein IH991_19585 [Planctomycetes bacterium]|nr:hypothetical protein [Planctomycetota bacterium]
MAHEQNWIVDTRESAVVKELARGWVALNTRASRIALRVASLSVALVVAWYLLSKLYSMYSSVSVLTTVAANSGSCEL